ncbi:hypothetical protein CDAR_55761 [Caerostris darwini]|uniref:Uncharacterized protein n=1 Tax=Caerostris darwini TaxID=1538125 RepID=A0AAV4VAC5_9ARAC|nr:hypothetical protein CDAR_55761 [Caerostris darwini]
MGVFASDLLVIFESRILSGVLDHHLFPSSPGICQVSFGRIVCKLFRTSRLLVSSFSLRGRHKVSLPMIQKVQAAYKAGSPRARSFGVHLSKRCMSATRAKLCEMLGKFLTP